MADESPAPTPQDSPMEHVIKRCGILLPERTSFPLAARNCVKKGAMRKGGKHLGWNFKQRVCVLAPPWLLWYVDEKSPAPSGFAHLDTVRGVAVESRSGSGRRGVCVVVEVADGTRRSGLRFVCRDGGEANGWRRAIEHALGGGGGAAAAAASLQASLPGGLVKQATPLVFDAAAHEETAAAEARMLRADGVRDDRPRAPSVRDGSVEAGRFRGATLLGGRERSPPPPSPVAGSLGESPDAGSLGTSPSLPGRRLGASPGSLAKVAGSLQEFLPLTRARSFPDQRLRRSSEPETPRRAAAAPRLPVAGPQKLVLDLVAAKARGAAPPTLALASPIVLRLRADAHARTIQRSLEVLIQRHPALRCAYDAESGTREVRRAGDVPSAWRRVRWTSTDSDELRAAVKEALDDGAMDVGRGQLLRATLLDIGVQSEHDADGRAPSRAGRGSLLLLCVHRLAADVGELMALLDDWRRVSAILVDPKKGRRARLLTAGDGSPVVDFCEWRRAHNRGGAAAERAAAYWDRELGGLRLDELSLDGVADRPAPPPGRETRRARVVPFAVDAGVVAEFYAACRRAEGADTFVSLLAVYATLLGKYERYGSSDGAKGDLSDVVVSILVGHENDLGLDFVVGDAASWIPVRVRLSGCRTFRDALAATRKAVDGALAHKDHVPEAVLLSDAMRGARFETASKASRWSGTELWTETALGLGDAHQRALGRAPKKLVDVGGVPLEPLPPPAERAGFADSGLTLWLCEDPAPFARSAAGSKKRVMKHAGAVRYAVDRYDRATAERACDHFKKLLESCLGALKHHDALDACSFVTDGETRLVAQWNATDTGDAHAGAVHGRGVHDFAFSETARDAPSSPALEFEAKDKAVARVAYGDLERLSGVLAAFLVALDGASLRPPPAAVCAPRDAPAAFVGILGVLRAARAYVPLDASYPLERLRYMLDASKASVLVATRGLADAVAGARDDEDAALVALVDDGGALSTPPPSRSRASGFEELPAGPWGPRPAYVIFTSGSTGKPKGVVLPHRALVNLVRWQTTRPGFEPCRTLQFAPLSFDVHAQELFVTWRSGAAVVLCPDATRRDFAGLLALISRRGVERLFAPFVALAGLADAWRDEPTAVALKEVVSAGERLQVTPGIATFLRACGTGATLWNHYGPSESHVCTAHELRAGAAWPTLPAIGAPVDNTKIYVLDKAREPCGVGVRGEIFIGGTCLARGYVGASPDADARFRCDGFARDGAARLYASGDVGRWLPGGVIECVGRLDDQVKVRGFRVELGDVEAALAAHGALRAVAATVVDAGDGAVKEKVLVAFAVVDEDELESLRRDGGARGVAANALPAYMVPSRVLRVAALPLTPSGKLDRGRLPPVEDCDDVDARDGAAPRATYADAVEAAVAAAFERALLLKSGSARAGDVFAELGGTSLAAARVASALRLAVPDLARGANLADALLRGSASVRSVARALRKGQAAPPAGSLATALLEEAAGDDGDDDDAGPALPRFDAAPRAGRRPPTRSEEAFWLERDRSGPGRASLYAVPVCAWLRPDADAARLEAAVKAVVRAREALRTRYVEEDGERYAEPLDGDAAASACWSATESDDAAAAVAAAAARTPEPFDGDGPLVFATLVTSGGVPRALALVFHHVAVDLWALEILLRDVADAYGGDAVRPETPGLLGAVAAWQRGPYASSPRRDAAVAFWRDAFSRGDGGAATALDVSTDRPRPKRPTFRAGCAAAALDDALVRAVAFGARQWRVSPLCVYASLWAATLGRFASQRDVVVGVPGANRDGLGGAGDDLVACCVNSLPLHVRLEDGADGPLTLAALCRRVGGALEAARRHGALPFADVAREHAACRGAGDGSRHAVFQTMFALHETPLGDDGALARVLAGATAPSAGADAGDGAWWERRGLALKPLALPASRRSCPFDATLTVVVGGGGAARCELLYAADLFDAATGDRLLRAFANLVASSVADVDAPLFDFPLLGPADERAARDLGVGADAAPSRPGVARLLDAHVLYAASAHAGRVALRRLKSQEPPEMEELTYGELAARASSLRDAWAAAAPGDACVAVCCRRGPLVVVAFLGAALGKRPYVPIDVKVPRARKTTVVLQSRAAILVLDDARGEAFVTLGDEVGGAGMWRATLADDEDERAVVAVAGGLGGSLWGAHGACRGHAAPRKIARAAAVAHDDGADPVLNIIFTSGSTGTPKGVLVPHGGLVALCWNLATKVYGDPCGCEDVFAQVAGAAFDAFGFEVWPGLFVGAAVDFAPEAAKVDPGALCAWLRRSRVTVAFVPTALLELVLKLEKGRGFDSCPALRTAHTGGDALHRGLPDHLLGSLKLLNEYGPTEATIACAAFNVGGGLDAPPIGKPLALRRLFVVDTANGKTLCPVGVPGELFVGGVGVARGYLDREDLTSAKFVDLDVGGAAERCYRTGDLVRWRGDGNLVFLRRLDSQVQIRGFRVELGEVAAALGARPDVAAAHVALAVPDADDATSAFLVAYVVPADLVKKLSVRKLRAAAADALPSYAVPARYVLLDELPYTPNGKVDAKALPDVTTATCGDFEASDGVGDQPRGEFEEIVAELIAQVLGSSYVPASASFFDLGGHSLAATQLAAKLRSAFDVDVPLSKIFDAPTARALAAFLEAASAGPRGDAADEAAAIASAFDAFPGDAWAEASGPHPLSYNQLSMYLSWRLAPDDAHYNVCFAARIRAPLDARALSAALEAVQERHAILRTVYALGDGGDPVQVVLEAGDAELDFEVVRTRGLDDDRVAALRRDEARTPFDLEEGPLLRGRLYVDADDDAPARGRDASGDGARARSLSPARRRSTRAALKAKTPQKPPRDTGSGGKASAATLDGATRASLALVDGAAQRAAKALGGELQLTLHHVACDGWSLGLLLDDVAREYARRVAGEAGAAREPAVSYAAFGRWQRAAYFESADAQASLAYWRGELVGKGDLPILELPTDFPRPSLQKFAGATVAAAVEGAVAERLQARARDRGCTLYVALLTAWAAFLHRHARADERTKDAKRGEIVVGAPLACRGTDEREKILGHCVNAMPLRIAFHTDATFGDALAAARDAVVGAVHHQDYPLAKLVDDLGLAADFDASRPALFQTLFALERAAAPGDALTPFLAIPGSSLELEGALRLESLPTDSETSAFDVSLSVAADPADGSLRCKVTYATALFRPATAAALAHRFAAFVATVADAPVDAKLGELDVVTAAEAGELEAARRGPALGGDPDRVRGTVLAKWLRSADTRGAAVALDDAAGLALSHGDLRRLAKEFADTVDELSSTTRRAPTASLPPTPLRRPTLAGKLRGLFSSETPREPRSRQSSADSQGSSDDGRSRSVCDSVDYADLGRSLGLSSDGAASPGRLAADAGDAEDVGGAAGGAVVVALPRTWRVVAAAVGAVASGRPYCLLDASHPPGRLERLARNARAAVLVAERPLYGDIGREASGDVAPLLPFDAGAARNMLEAARREPLPEVRKFEAAAAARVAEDDAAYVQYTSGSTGAPKAIVVGHGALAHACGWHEAEYGTRAADVAAQCVGTGFDPWNLEVWPFFAVGAAVAIVDDDARACPASLSKRLAEARATFCLLPTPLVELLFAFYDAEAAPPKLPDLRVLYFGGDKLKTLPPAALYAAAAASLRVDNHYGPAECTVLSTLFEIPRPGRRGGFDLDDVPIGRPLSCHVTCDVVDARLRRVPVGVVGELVVGGLGVADGYMGMADVTARKFVADPFDGGDRIYRTGDLARWRRGGDGSLAIHFVGRADDQVKIRGMRCELGEIEAALAGHAGVDVAVAVAAEGKVAGYYVPRGDPSPDLDLELAQWCRSRLPAHACPSAFIPLARLPYTPNGKVDRRALPAPDWAALAETRRDDDALADDGRGPRTATEARVASAFALVLRVDEHRVGVHRSFFDLGGTSLSAAHLLGTVERVFGAAPKLSELFAAPTVAALAALLDARGSGGGAPDDAFDLESEVVLDDAIRPRPRHDAAALAARVAKPRACLVTGATGFVGSYLLRELAASGRYARVYCLVRARDDAEAAARVRTAVLNFVCGGDEAALGDVDLSRVAPLRGDLALARLGLTEAAWDEVRRGVDAVFHSGSLVNFLYPFQALKAANVGGTVELLKLCAAAGGEDDAAPVPLHFVSSLSTLGGGDNGFGEDAALAPPGTVFGGYAQTKWVAERLVLLARDRGLPVTVHRPPRVVGDRVRGGGNFDDFLFLALRGAAELGSAPDISWTERTAPVDFVATAVAALAADAANLGGCFHYLSEAELQWADLFAWARAFGADVGAGAVPFSDWKDRVKAAGPGENALFPLLPVLDEFGEIADFPAFTSTATDAALARAGLPLCPSFDEAAARTHFARMADLGLLPMRAGATGAA